MQKFKLGHHSFSLKRMHSSRGTSRFSRLSSSQQKRWSSFDSSHSRRLNGTVKRTGPLNLI